MRKQNGITLVALVLYIILMIIILGIMTLVTNEFYKNTDTVQGNVQEVIEFNKFNNYFLKEIKTNNKVDKVSNNYILFSSGNSFSISNESIYYNNIKVCEGVKNLEITLGKNGDGVDRTIINVTLTFENFSKSISYKIENIY